MMSQRIPQHIHGLLALALSLLPLAACGGDDGGARSTTSASACAAATDCALPDQVCVEGVCAPCRSDAMCHEDHGPDALCINGACQLPATTTPSCPDGDLGCPCLANGGCGAGLRCEDAACAWCPPGEHLCPCATDAQAACQGELRCLNDVCAPDPCPSGSEGCPCHPERRCDDDDALRCGDDGVCRPCSPDIEGCPCDDTTTCGDGLTCQGDTCRSGIRCADLPCASQQRCEERGPRYTATCLPDCMPGWTWEPDTRRCLPRDDTNCDPNSPNNVLNACLLLGRACDETGARAECGDCQTGFFELPGQAACQPLGGGAALGCFDAHRRCEPNDAGDPACGACLPGFTEAQGRCVPDAELNCDPAGASSLVAYCASLGRRCQRFEGGAACGACLPGQEEDPNTEACAPVATCDAIYCDALNRTCIQAEGDTCGRCKDGYLPTDPDDLTTPCRPLLTCNEVRCGFGTFCQEGDPGFDAFCAPRPCPEGWALREDTGECVLCGILCGERGETGELWPTTLTNDSQCLCHTEPGYYFDLSGNLASRPCDEDGDGWLRVTALNALSSDDPGLQENARCTPHTIDRFTLRNEWREELDVWTCQEGLVRRLACSSDADCDVDGGRCDLDDGHCACNALQPVALVESVRNDDQIELEQDNPEDIPPVASRDGRGRSLLAVELNALTRACVTAGGDFNDNGVADVSEHQDGAPDPDQDPALRIFSKMSYFTELHTGAYSPPGPGEVHGRYLIAERSRCDEDFPLGYTAQDRDYWRSCTRNRDAAYNPDLSQAFPIGFDFARWSCDASTGACPLLQPPTAAISSEGIEPHGLCDRPAEATSDGLWRGMNHHSQFKCVEVVGASPEFPTFAPQQIRRDQLWDGGTGAYQANTCRVVCPEEDPDCADDCAPPTRFENTDSDGDGLADMHQRPYCQSSTELSPTATGIDAPYLNNQRPEVTCDSAVRAEVEVGDVVFAAVRFERGGVYARGCIDEWDPSPDATDNNLWRALCPGYLQNPTGVKGQGNGTNFGELICGCSQNYGGPLCDIPCPAPLLGGPGPVNPGDACVEGGYCVVTEETETTPGGRRGFWMCGGLAISSAVGLHDPRQMSVPFDEDGNGANDGFNLQGSISPTPFSGARHCSTGQGDAQSRWCVQNR
ncbi:MAG: hypothetical protein CMH57_05270 [Myxococcales bacterium]|nr:hypothetical protein [Myxococcales bacterium]